MNIAIKNLRTGPSMEYGPNGAVQCSVYFNDKKVCTFTDYGDGGESFTDNHVQPLYKTMIEWFQKEIIPENPPKKYGEGEGAIEIDYSIDQHIFKLIGEFEENKYFKRVCKKNTLFITKDCPKGEYYKFKFPYTEKIKEHIQKQHGENLVEIINERFL